MVVKKFLENISFKQSKWLEKNISLNTKKNETELNMILKKTSLYYLLLLFLVEL